MEKTKENAFHNEFKIIFSDFADQLLSTIFSYQDIMSTLEAKQKRITNAFANFLKMHVSKNEKGQDRIPYQYSQRFQLIISQMNQQELAIKQYPISALISIHTIYEAFTSDIFKFYLKQMPESVYSRQKTIPIDLVIKSNDLEQIKYEIINNEVEEIMRNSWPDQYDHFARNHNTDLISQIDNIQKLFEITFRRNLAVHNKLVVNKQYLNSVKKNCPEIEASLNQELKIDFNYIKESTNTLFESAFIIHQILWRKSAKKQKFEITEVNKFVMEIGFDMITKGHYDISSSVFKYTIAKEVREMINETDYFYCILNLAQSHKWKGNQKEMDSILEKHNWDAKNSIIKMAYYCLKDNFEEASSLMEITSKDQTFNHLNYSNWPIFKEFIESREFKDTYKKIYDKEFEKNMGNEYLL